MAQRVLILNGRGGPETGLARAIMRGTHARDDGHEQIARTHFETARGLVDTELSNTRISSERKDELQELRDALDRAAIGEPFAIQLATSQRG